MITSHNQFSSGYRLNSIRIIVTIAVICAVLTATIIATAETTAAANPSSSTLLRADASGLHQAVNNRRATVAAACSLAATFYVKSRTPVLEGSSVKTPGSVTQVPNWYCLVEQIWVTGQTKVCGFWGCDWHTKATNSHSGRTASWSATATQNCRSGTHRYRTRSGISYRHVSGLVGIIPTNTIEHKWVESTVQPEFTCT